MWRPGYFLVLHSSTSHLQGSWPGRVARRSPGLAYLLPIFFFSSYRLSSPPTTDLPRATRFLVHGVFSRFVKGHECTELKDPTYRKVDDAAASSGSLEACLDTIPPTPPTPPDRLEPGVCRTTEFLGPSVSPRCRACPKAHPCLRWGWPHSYRGILLFKTESPRRVTRKHENPPYARRLPALFRYLRSNLSITITHR